MFPLFFPPGGWIALAATHFHFIREIPMLSTYETRNTIATFDQKWIYILHKFVRKSDGKKAEKHVKPKTPSPTTDAEISEETMIVRTPGSEEISSTGTPFPSDTPMIRNITASESSGNTERALNAVAAGLAGEEPDGAMLHTIVVSQCCYKIGRITVPPALVLAVNGFTGASGYSHRNPHPEWAEARKLMAQTAGGSKSKLRKFLTGGWRDVPEEDRWWEKAMGPNVEETRVRNLRLIEGLKNGLENARGL